MTQPFEPAPQPGPTPLSDRAMEAQNRQAAVAELTRRIKNGANNFYWIAALSAINSFVLQFGGNSYFVVGLAITLLVDGVFIGMAEAIPEASLVVKVIGLAISIFIAGIFALFGLFGNRGKRWAFITGIVLYTLDALLMLVFQEWLGLAFHALFLFGLFGGLRALNELSKLTRPDAPDFPQNIGAP